jgi:hypothetical protein
MAKKRAAGRPPQPKQLRKTGRVLVLLTPADHRRLSRYARARDTTISGLLRDHVRKLLLEAGGDEHGPANE